MDTKKAQELLQKYREGTLSPEEKNILDGWALQLVREENLDFSGIDLETNQAASFDRLLAAVDSQKTTRVYGRVSPLPLPFYYVYPQALILRCIKNR